MRASMYFNYTSRSLFRGGQRTVLAVFCVAVGVMAIVALQLVGQMINNAFTTNVRNANGGDIAVTSQSAPFKQSDLNFFDKLKSNGTITNYTPLINADGSIGLAVSISQSFTLQVVDPNSFPVVTPPTFQTPTDGRLAHLLTNNQVVVDHNLLDQYKKKVGDSFKIHIGTRNGNAITIPVKIVGVVNDTGVFAQSNDFMLIALADYHAADPKTSLLYDTIDVVTADKAHTDQAARTISEQFRIASVVTADQALKNNQAQVDFIKKFLEVAGLLALLIGGVGIVNTMQVLLSRRRVEIAMLKTTGYRRFDLYLLFGLEAALLGLIGGVVGAGIAIGVSALIRILVENLFPVVIPFVLDPVIIGGVVLFGLLFALIFLFMPIVQAANIRPLNVIRELPEGNRAGSIALTIGLLLILSVLFCVLAIVILNDVILGLSAVYGAFIFLGLLSLFFGLVVLIVSILPVPERFSIKYLALILAGMVLSVLVALVLPTFGYLLLALSLLGIVIVLLPRTWKSNTKLALRNVGRQRARTTTTMLALFIGVFTIGLILILGQNLRDKINNALATSLNYNVVTIASGKDTSALQSQLATIPGLTKHNQTAIATTSPAQINGQPIAQVLHNVPSGFSFSNLGRDGVISSLSGVEGYNVANGQVPDTTNLKITDGRNLNASDAGTNNALLPWQLVHLAPLKGHVNVGSTITLLSLDKKHSETLTIVGVYRSTGFGGAFEPVLTTTNAVQALSPAGVAQSIFCIETETKQHRRKLAG